MFNPQIDTCYSEVNRTMHSRKWHRRFEKIEPDGDGWHPTDGALVWVTPDLPPAPEFGLQDAAGSDLADQSSASGTQLSSLRENT